MSSPTIEISRSQKLFMLWARFPNQESVFVLSGTDKAHQDSFVKKVSEGESCLIELESGIDTQYINNQLIKSGIAPRYVGGVL